jgi:hypothetical protein
VAEHFRGPGEWRSQAEGAQLPENPFASLHEHYRRLTDKGEHAAASHVREAQELMRSGETDAAAESLHQAAAKTSPSSAAHAEGLRLLAEELEPEG